MKARRLVLVLAMVSIPVFAAADAAGATKPARTCPPAFQGPLTFQQVVEAFPPPPDLPPEQVQAILESIDHNGDGMLCAKGLPDSENFIDNTANVP
jgi:hypothetical protein